MAEHDPPGNTGVSEQKTRLRSGGRPAYKPTDAQRLQVGQLAAAKRSRTAIAKAIGISPVTLRKHFAAELGLPGPSLDDRLKLEGVHRPVPIVCEPGRPEFEPTLRQRDDVRLCKADDWSDDHIARHLGISRNTLLKHFAEELDYGADQVRMRNLRNLQRAADSGNVSACNALLKMGESLPVSLPLPREEPLGKKERALRDAQTAEQGTSWQNLVN